MTRLCVHNIKKWPKMRNIKWMLKFKVRKQGSAQEALAHSVFPPYFQNRMHWNRVVYPRGSGWNFSPWSCAARHKPAPLSAVVHTTMAVNPNFFPNGYQDPMHPEDEVVTNWVRASFFQTSFYFLLSYAIVMLSNCDMISESRCGWIVMVERLELWLILHYIQAQSNFGSLETRA